MPRTNRDMESLIGRKVRKRACSSSSSTSSLLQNYRFKKTVVVKKRGGSSTPLPAWKIGSRSPSSMVGISESPRYPISQTGSRSKQAPISVRKLAATLWESNEMPSPGVKEDLKDKRDSKKGMRAREWIARSIRSGSLPPHLSDPSHSPVSERMDRSGTNSLRRRMSEISQKIRPNKRNGGGLDSLSSTSLMEIETRSRGTTPAGSVVGHRSSLKNLSNSLTTSKELLKILNRICGLEEQHSSSMSLFSALHTELERAHMQIDQLIQEQRSNGDDVNRLMRQFAEEKAAWKNKEKEKIAAAIQSFAGELEVEKKLRRRAESLNSKLGRELAETRTTLSNAIKELEREKKARERIERVCDGLAKGIGEDKAAVEELKRESMRFREEIEKEREVLQVTDMPREERAQMKPLEDKPRFKEKNGGVSKLRNNIEAFLKMRNSHRNHAGMTGIEEEKKVGHLRKTHSMADHDVEGKDRVMDNGKRIEDELDESDLHSIELNRDSNKRSSKWNHAPAAFREGSEDIRGRKSISKKLTTGSVISHDGNMMSEGGIQRGFGIEKLPRRGGGTDRGRLSESSSLFERQLHKEDYYAGRYDSMKGLRDHILSGSRIGFAPGFASPTRQWA